MLIAGITAVVMCVGGWEERRRLRKKYWWRMCTGLQWRERFPEAPKEDIREFLREFTEAFGFGKKRALKFAPDDKIGEIYRTRYPTAGLPDRLEMVDFALMLERRYGVDMTGRWREDVTLGDIFAMTQEKGRAGVECRAGGTVSS